MHLTLFVAFRAALRIVENTFCFVAISLGMLTIDQNLELVHVRTKINELVKDESVFTTIVEYRSENADRVSPNVLSPDWCFVDCKLGIVF